MQHLSQFLQGLLFAGGFVAGMCIVGWFIYRALTKGDDDYEARDLFDAFKVYEGKLTDDEHYEQIREVQSIIGELKKGNIPDLVKDYEIESETSVIMEEEGDSKQVIRWKEHLTVLRKIEKKP